MKRIHYTLVTIAFLGAHSYSQYQIPFLSTLFENAEYSKLILSADSILQKDSCSLEPLYFKSLSRLKAAKDSSLFPFSSILKFEKCY
jgi:hypothetical protein